MTQPQHQMRKADKKIQRPQIDLGQGRRQGEEQQRPGTQQEKPQNQRWVPSKNEETKETTEVYGNNRRDHRGRGEAKEATTGWGEAKETTGDAKEG